MRLLLWYDLSAGGYNQELICASALSVWHLSISAYYTCSTIFSQQSHVTFLAKKAV